MSDAYALIGVPKTASTAQIRDAYKEKAMMNHPDRGGDVAMWGQLQKAYDILSDPARRAEYDSNGSVRDGSSEKKFAEGFVGTGAGGKKMSIVNQLDESRDKDGSLAQAGYNMSHSSGFDAWMRNQKGLGKTGFYTAEDLLRSNRGGI